MMVQKFSSVIQMLHLGTERNPGCNQISDDELQHHQ